MKLIAEQLKAFHRIVLQLLSDVQERLVYRAHIYVQNDIIGYKPVSGDLAYPEKLEMMEVIREVSFVSLGFNDIIFHCMQSIAEGLQNQASQSLGRSVSVSSVSSQDTVRSHTGSNAIRIIRELF